MTVDDDPPILVIPVFGVRDTIFMLILFLEP